MNLQDKIKVMQAYQDGKSVESHIKSNPKDEWYLCTTPEWNWRGYDYRIKEEETPRVHETLEEMDLRHKEPLFGVNPITPSSSNNMFDNMMVKMLDGTMKQADISAWRDIHCKIINALISKHDDIDTVTDKATKIMLSMMVFEKTVTKNPDAFDISGKSNKDIQPP